MSWVGFWRKREYAKCGRCGWSWLLIGWSCCQSWPAIGHCSQRDVLTMEDKLPPLWIKRLKFFIAQLEHQLMLCEPRDQSCTNKNKRCASAANRRRYGRGQSAVWYRKPKTSLPAGLRQVGEAVFFNSSVKCYKKDKGCSSAANLRRYGRGQSAVWCRKPKTSLPAGLRQVGEAMFI